MKGTLAVVLVVSVLGCAPSPAMKAAQGGDRSALHDALQARERAGDLSTREAASLARAVADREVRGAPAGEALDRVRDVRPCARELDGALRARMATRDAAGAEAALARIDARGLSLGDARELGAGSDAPMRRVRARGLVRTEDRRERLLALADADPGVRREAARAARDAGDAADLSALVEAARLDPEPLVRTEAVRAIAALPPTPGGEAAVALRDLWTAGDEPLRGDVAVALAGTPVWGAGGREALRVIVASGEGSAAVEAAAAVLRRRDADVDLGDAALGQLVRSIDGGSRVTRLQSLAQAPLDRPRVLEAVGRAAADDDLEVRVAALARLVEVRDSRGVPGLEALAQPGSPVAVPAQLALAFAGDRRVQAWLETSLEAPSSQDRLAAAMALSAMGVAGRAASLLADPDAAVRVRAACAIMMAARVRGAQ